MRKIFEESFQNGYRRVVMIGSDAPEMDRRTVRRAFRQLRSRPAVFQPTVDGGYALVGMSRMLDVFSGIPWSTAAVMAKTRRRLGILRVRHTELPESYDIDTAGDLARWRGRP